MGFYGGLENDLLEYKDTLIFDREYPITKESVVMDMLIFRKNKNIEIKNEIGAVFIFLESVRRLKEQGDKNNARAVMKISARENGGL